MEKQMPKSGIKVQGKPSKVLRSAAVKRLPPNAGKGRVKGVPNALTRELKAMVLGALDAKGGQQWLERQMDANPVAMISLLSRLLPSTIHAEIRDDSSRVAKLQAAIARANQVGMTEPRSCLVEGTQLN
jgi:hypothetical protein